MSVHAGSTPLDRTTPNAARMYDYWLGGAHNFAADRDLGDRIADIMPARAFARNNQAFVRRVVRYLIQQVGIHQVLILGSGVPTVGNVHEVAQDASPDCRVVYLESDPVAVALWEQTLAHNDLATVIQGDLQDPDVVLNDTRTRQLLDFGEPVGVLLSGGHFVRDEAHPLKIIAGYREAMCPGGRLAISHVTADDCPIEVALAADAFKGTNTPLTARTRDQITRLFTGFALVEPGVVLTAEWRPERPGNTKEASQSLCYGGVAER